MNKIVILKNDRTGDLFTSIPLINLIFNKYKNKEIEIFLSKVNCKFSFLFKKKKIKIINLNLNLFDKIQIFLYLLVNKVDAVYILTPKNFYFYIPLLLYFKKIKFYGICIDSKKQRPYNFLRNFLYKKVVINRINIMPRKSSYDIQRELLNYDNDVINLLNTNAESNLNFDIPNNSVFFHYKHKMFKDLLEWDFFKVKKFIEFLHEKKGSVIFSSEINNKLSDSFFQESFNTYDFSENKSYIINSKKILFLKNIDGLDLYTAIKKSNEIVAPEGIITHIGYHLNKKILSLMHFKLLNRQDFINQIISCKEWFPPKNFKYTVLKKDFDMSLNKISKRI